MPCNMTPQQLDVSSYQTGVDGKLRSNDPNGTLGNDTYMTVRSQNQSVNAGGTISLVAPAAVRCNAKGIAAIVTDRFCESGHRFKGGNTGPSGTGSWPYPATRTATERMKDERVTRGLATFLYEDAGAFTLRHRVRLLDNSERDSADTTVNIQSADSFYSGVSTVCMHQGTEGNIVSGSSSLDITSGHPVLNSNTRYLYRRGGDYSSLGELSIPGGLHNVQIGAYDSGAPPILGDVSDGYSTPNSASETDWPSVITIMDLNIGHLANWTITLDHTYIRCTIRNGSTVGGAMDFYALVENSSPEVVAAYRPNRGTAFIDCDLVNNFVSQKATLFRKGAEMTLLGCRVGTPTLYVGSGDNEHTIRDFQSNDSVIDCCQLDAPAPGGRCTHRIHSGGLLAPSETSFNALTASEFNVIAYTEIRGDSINAFGLWRAPQNDSIQWEESVKDSAIQSCDFTGFSGAVTEMGLGGERIGYTGCTFNRTPFILTGFKIINGMPDGPYLTPPMRVPSEFI